MTRRVTRWLPIVLAGAILASLSCPTHAARRRMPATALNEQTPQATRSTGALADDGIRATDDGAATGDGVPAARGAPGARASLALGERLLAAGKYEEAVKALRETLALEEGRPKGDAQRARTLVALARAYGPLGEETMAGTCLELVLRDGPAAWRSEAQFQMGLLASSVLTLERFRQALGSLAHEDPMAMDFDILRYLVGFQKGYRVEAVDRALEAFENTWKKYPKGERAPDALLHQALLEGLVLTRPRQAMERLDLLAKRYPDSKARQWGGLVGGIIAMTEGKLPDAVTRLAAVDAHSDAAAPALFFLGLAQAYYLEKADKALAAFQTLAETGGDPQWKHLGLVHEALIHLTVRRDPASAKDFCERIPGDAARQVVALRDDIQATAVAQQNAKTDDERAFRLAEFWYAHQHYYRASRELGAFLARYPTSAFAPTARLYALRIRQDDLPGVPGQAALPETEPAAEPERQEELRLRQARDAQAEGHAQGLESIYQDKGSPYRALAAGDLVRAAGVPEGRRRHLIEEVATSEKSGEVRARMLSQLARSYVEAGSPRRALELYRQALPLDPKLAGEVEHARNMVEARDEEARIGRVQDATGRIDPMALVTLGKLDVLLGREADARKLFQKAARVGGKSRTGDTARFELMELNVKGAKFSLQALRFVNDYLNSIGPDGVDRIEALETKVALLEKFGDADKELEPLYRYLAEHSPRGDTARLALARRMVDLKKPDQAVALLAPVHFPAATEPRALLLLASCYESTREKGLAQETLRRLALRYPTTGEGKEAGERYAAQAARAMEKELASASPGAIDRIVHGFTLKVDAAWLGAVRPTLGKLTDDAVLPRLSGETALALAHLIMAARIGGNTLAALFEAARTKLPQRASQIQLEQAAALEESGETARAAALVRELAPRDARAALALGRIQARVLHDNPAAYQTLTGLMSRRDATDPLVEEATRLAAEVAAAWPKAPAGPEALERKALARLTDRDARARVQEDLARRIATPPAGRGAAASVPGERRVEAAHMLLAAAGDLSGTEREDAVLEASGWLIAQGRYEEASTALRDLSQGQIAAAHPERVRELLLRSEALLAISHFKKNLNWEDPESASNLQVLLSMIRLDINPLKDFDGALALLSQAEGLFGKSAADQLALLRNEITRRIRLKSLEDREERLPRDLMELATNFEEDLGDRAESARWLRRLIEMYPDDPITVLARLRLVRLDTLYLGEREEAATQIHALTGTKDRTPLAPEIKAAVNQAAAESAVAQLRERIDASIAGGRLLEAIGPIEALGKMAVGQLDDTGLAMDLVHRLEDLAARQSPPAPALLKDRATQAAYRLALSGAIAIPAQKQSCVAGPGRGAFLEKALALARTPAQRGVVQFERARDDEEAGDEGSALEAYGACTKECPPAAWMSEAYLAMAGIYERRGDPAHAREAYQHLAQLGQEVKVDRSALQIASSKIPKLEKQQRSQERDEELASSNVPAEGYYHTAVSQLEEDGDLERALTNFRTYIRLGHDPRMLLDAHMQASEILLRLERPREAIDTLRRAQDRFPQSPRRPELLYRLGLAYEVHVGDLSEAKKRYEEVLKLARTSKWAQESRKGLTRIDETIAERSRAEKAAGGKSSVAADIAAIKKKYLKEKGSYEDAITVLKAQIDAAQVPSEKAQLYKALGEIEDTELHNARDAVDAYEHYIDLTSDNFGKGDVYLRVAELKAGALNSPQDAVDMYKEFPSRFYNHPKKVNALLAEAQLMETKLDDAQGALNIYRNIADAYPRSGSDEKALLRIADLSRKYFADFPSAVDALRQLVRTYPFSENAPYAQLQVAQILETELGDLNGASVEYQKLIDAYPQSGYADAARNALVRIKGRY